MQRLVLEQIQSKIIDLIESSGTDCSILLNVIIIARQPLSVF